MPDISLTSRLSPRNDFERTPPTIDDDLPIISKKGQIQDVRVKLRRDEYEITFRDDSKHAADSWKDIERNARKSLSEADSEIAQAVHDYETLSNDIETKYRDFDETQLARPIASIRPFPRTLDKFVGNVESKVKPFAVDMSLVWSMVYYNIELSVMSLEKLKHTTSWLSKVRRSLEVCNSCIDNCENQNELRLALPDILDPLVSLLEYGIWALRQSMSDVEFLGRWRSQIERKQRECLASLDDIIKHLNEMNSYSKVNQDREARYISMRTEAHPEQEELANFPIMMLPLERNPLFYGRNSEIDAINDHLGRSDNKSLLTYTIYGRRGVGKTHIALEYAYRNPAKFDAIFWIRCETSASLRQSFTDAGAELNIPFAAEPGHFEENLVSVQKWLKKTKKRWLLIFDNAEKEGLLAGYWPLGARGCILITSRTHYNFMKDNKRHGETVPLFGPEESLELLLKFLGQTWQQKHLVDPFEESDMGAAKGLMKKIGGLVLAIHQAASIILARDCSIRQFLDTYVEKWNSLPPRQVGRRDPLIHALDSIWSVAFDVLSPEGRAFLGVLAFLAPDLIQRDLFIPRNQAALDGVLEFCKLDPNGHQGIASLATVAEVPSGLQRVITELADRKLIRVHEREQEFSVHRVIQEAMHYQNFDDLQAHFNAAVRVVYEAFPKKQPGDPLFDQWAACELYIHHALQLYNKYREYSPVNRHAVKFLQPISEFIRLGANCGWYLLEIADYNECIAMVGMARSLCQDQNALLVAHLRNTAASAYFELNELKPCRQDFEEALRIREKNMSPDDREVAVSLANLANLETAEEHFDEARDLLNRAAAIRMKIGDPAAIMLAVTYLQLGRVETLDKNYPAAIKMMQKTEVLINRQPGSRDYLADLQFAYGNVEYSQGKYSEAAQYFRKCKDQALNKRPLHPIVGAAFYKLGSCEYELDHPLNAKNWLVKALNIAEIRNPGRNDGTVARILWKLAQVLKEIDVSTEEAQEMENRALLIRQQIIGRTGAEDRYEEEGYDDMEHSYDILVCGFFR